ncbi:MAG: SufD family Fe-S cluster assembly protein [Candidatus Levybacteria bacterium]|nr:SufD family Fe-S cluster assembly protein [Candidatus Levybacteria bacterium]
MKKIELVLKKNEEKILPVIWIDDDETEIHLAARLVGDGAKLTVLGLFFATENRAVVFTTDVMHEGKHTTSLTRIRGVFKNRSSFNNDGIVRIRKGAKNANGFFDSKVLLFDDAKGRSVPSLEIDENEVKAGHASTIGRPDALQLLYLRSRGLSEEEAESLIVTGFFDQIKRLLPEKERRAVEKKLGGSA